MSLNENHRLSNQRIDFFITAAVFLVALALYSISWDYSLSNGYLGLSGGKYCVGAERVLSGDIPYRDFWTMYAPGLFYLLALLFKIFGPHHLVNVAAGSVVCAAAACALYWLCLKLVERRPLALACAVIFLAATYFHPYFKNLGSYPPAILLIFTALILMILYYKVGKLFHLLAAGMTTGAIIIFKHDVAGYTCIVMVSGLIAHNLTTRGVKPYDAHSLLLKLITYLAGVVLIVMPPLLYFSILAGPDILQDLIVFPLTDFRFSRPEWYPGISPLWIYHESSLMMFRNFLVYLIYNVPFVLFILGLIAAGMAWRRGKPDYVAASVTFSVGFLLHYVAAHVQINTHIITLSVYAACLGSIFYDLMEGKISAGRLGLTRLIVAVFVCGWFLALAARPAYDVWKHWTRATAELQLAKVSGFKVTPREADILSNLVTFVDSHVPPDQKLFVGLHRHDVVIIGDAMIYFILDRPLATRYQELHPALTDTAPIQQEIIQDLQAKKVSVIILKKIFKDQELNRAKKDFLKNLPNIGATDLDDFIRDNYVNIREFGPYTIWKRRGAEMQITEAYFKGSTEGTKK
jgi:hypothetical protein